MANLNDYAQFSSLVYLKSDTNKLPLPSGWRQLLWQTDTVGGFSAGAYIKDNEVVIAYTGTNEGLVLDFATGNIPAAVGLPSGQVMSAIEFYLAIRDTNPGANISFTGHSMGGGLAALMAVYFARHATTFDPAPFLPSATTLMTLGYYQSVLALQGLSDPDFSAYTPNPNALFPARQANVEAHVLEGEALSAIPWIVSGTIADPARRFFYATAGSTTPVNLHSMVLLAAVIRSEKFQDAVTKISAVLPAIFDPLLYAADPKISNKPDFMHLLLQQEWAYVGDLAASPLSRFADDLLVLVPETGLRSEVQSALVIAAMEYRYFKDAANASQLFSISGNGIHFKYSDIGATSYKSLTRLVNAIESTLTQAESASLAGKLIQQDVWHIQIGTAGMNWTATGAGNDAAFGGSAADTIQAGAGNDVLIGDAGEDQLHGGQGADQLYGGADNDTLRGGDGNDTLSGGAGNDTLEGGANDDTLLDQEGDNTLRGDDGDDVLTAGSGNDTLEGGAGKDVLNGASGNDTLNGGDEDDVLTASEGNDHLDGGAGQDTLIGGAGNDTLLGGAEADLLQGGAGKDILEGGAGGDTYIWNGGDGYDVLRDHGDNQLQVNDQDAAGLYKETQKGSGIWASEETGLRMKPGGPGWVLITPQGETLGLGSFANGDYGIVLEDNKDDDPDDNLDDAMGGNQDAYTKTRTQTVSPLILDLDGDGVETLAQSQGLWFDHAGDGLAEQSGWINKDDGLLVRDLNGDGRITDGRELFGNQTGLTANTPAPNGFEALKMLDANKDGVVNAQDPEFASLRIWIDANSDAETQQGELRTPEQLGILSLGTGYSQGSTRDAQGNHHAQLGAYTTTGYQTRSMTDVWFATNPTFHVEADPLPLSDAIQALPNARGYGLVHDLHQSMARNPELQTLVTRYTQADTQAERETLTQQILYAWSGADRYTANSRGAYIGDGRIVYIVEAFLAQGFIQHAGANGGTPNPGPNASRQITAVHNNLREMLYAQLASQSHLRPLFDRISYAWRDNRLTGDLKKSKAVNDAEGRMVA